MDNLNRYQYQMSEADVGELLKASVAWPGVPGGSTAESVKLAWKAIGSKMGFDPSTVLLTGGKGYRFFTAIPIEQQKTREMEEYEKECQDRIHNLKQAIAALSTELRIFEEHK